MPEITSGLPHFSNSQAAMNNWEPLYLNQFEVIITPPATVNGADILIEHVKKLSGLPEITPVGFVEQHYKFAKRTYAAAKPEDTTAELEIDFEVNLNDSNSMYIYNTLRQWADIHFDPMTGAQGLKAEYAGEMTVLIHNKKLHVYREFKFKPVFMIEPLKEMELDYLSEDIYVLTAKFKADAWKEARPTDGSTGIGEDVTQ
jgi:hypothetical protein